MRNGFVSNSSSSSFIIGGNSIKKSALAVFDNISKYIKDNHHYDNDYKKTMSRLEQKRSVLIKLCNLPDVKSGKCGVMFASCNYDTYIIYNKEYDQVYITTCNNFGTPEFDEPCEYGMGSDGGDDDVPNAYINKQLFYCADLDNDELYMHDDNLYENRAQYNINRMYCPECGEQYKIYLWDVLLDQYRNLVCGRHGIKLVCKNIK